MLRNFPIYLSFHSYIFRRFAAADLLENDSLAHMKSSRMHHCIYSFTQWSQIVFSYNSCLIGSKIRGLKYMRNWTRFFFYINLGLILANMFWRASFNSFIIYGKNSLSSSLCTSFTGNNSE